MTEVKLKAAKSRHAAVRLHDQLNLLTLPVISVMAVAGIFQLYDPFKVTLAMVSSTQLLGSTVSLQPLTAADMRCMQIAYIVADFAWIALQPQCLPSLPTGGCSW